MESNILSHLIHHNAPHQARYRFFLFFPVLKKIVFTKFWSKKATRIERYDPYTAVDDYFTTHKRAVYGPIIMRLRYVDGRIQ
jgi:hypothetical protein